LIPGYTPFNFPSRKAKIVKTSVREVITKLLKPASMMVTTTPRSSRNKAQHYLLAGLAVLQGKITDINVDDVIQRMEQRQQFT
jgi:hypothetical protein